MYHKRPLKKRNLISSMDGLKKNSSIPLTAAMRHRFFNSARARAHPLRVPNVPWGCSRVSQSPPGKANHPPYKKQTIAILKISILKIFNFNFQFFLSRFRVPNVPAGWGVDLQSDEHYITNDSFIFSFF